MRFVKALLLPVLVAGGWVATTGPAHAAGSCSIVVPAKVSVKAFSTRITAHLKSDCAASGMELASWGDSKTRAYVLWTFDGSRKSATGTFPATNPIGPKHAFALGANDADGNVLTQNQPVFVIKNGTWVYVASSRQGRAVYINGLVHQWSVSNAFPSAGRKVYLQRFVNGSWQSMLSRTTNGSGKVTVGFIQSTARRYRLVAAETSRGWSGTSSSTIR
jgi:hypothetical protein